MEEERVCVVVYKEQGATYHYAVLRRVKNWEGWELVKGHVDAEDLAASARQEIVEELGIDDITTLEPVDHTLQWDYEENGEQVHVTCHCFMAEVPADARISVADNPHAEHEDGYFLNYRDARDILHHENQRELLRVVHEQLGQS